METRQVLFDTMVIKPEIQSKLKKKTDTLIANKARYEEIAHHFPNPGFKWYIVAVIHEMECSQNFSKYLGNGQDLSKVTTIVPKGRGPFKSFYDGAIDALNLQGVNSKTDWSMEGILTFLESYNGFGYEKKGIASPYLFAGSNHYTSGKFIKDHVYDPNAVSDQVGVALMLKQIMDK